MNPNELEQIIRTSQVLRVRTGMLSSELDRASKPELQKLAKHARKAFDHAFDAEQQLLKISKALQ